jgi:transposase
MQEATGSAGEKTVGLDLGDRSSRYCILSREGTLLEEGRIATTEASLRRHFSALDRARVAFEVGAHSPWVSRLLADCGHEVIAANPRQIRLIYGNHRKSDRADAEYLARLARLDPKLLAPVAHRGEQAQADLALLRSRDVLVRARADLVNHVRGAVKAVGCRVPKCSTPVFARRAEAHVPEPLQPALLPVLDTITQLSEQVREMDRWIEELAKTEYPETDVLRQVPGVGSLTALCYVLTLEDPARFPTSREVGAYVGLVPKRHSSGQRDPQLGITRAGDRMLRRLLVQAAHYTLGPFGPDSDLRRFGEKLAERGGKNAKKRAIVAVARKLAVLLHSLWSTGEVYEPLRHHPEANQQPQAA